MRLIKYTTLIGCLLFAIHILFAQDIKTARDSVLINFPILTQLEQEENKQALKEFQKNRFNPENNKTQKEITRTLKRQEKKILKKRRKLNKNSPNLI